MGPKYLLEWLDALVSVTLNPEKTLIEKITKEQINFITRNISKETSTIKSKLKHEVFSLSREKQIRLLLQNYYSSLQILLAQVIQCKDHPLFQQERLKQVLILLESSLQDLLSFLETWFAPYLNPEGFSKRRQKKAGSRTRPQKILCNLSTDQAALVLRAADELRILKARSLRSVFKQITPYLSTPGKKEISFEAMRVNAYKAEERDKQIAITELERIIEKIKGY